jgi:Subtilase family
VRIRALPAGARAAAAVLGLALLMVFAILLAGGTSLLGPRDHAAALADAAPYDGRSPVAPSGARLRVLVSMPRPALGDLPNVRRMSGKQQLAYENSLKHEASATRSALGARGIKLTDVVAFARVFNGFAATVRASDLARLTSPGVRPAPVRRLYPASAEPVPLPGPAPPAPDAAAGATVAVLDTGVDTAVVPLRGRSDPGYDAVDRDHDPAPGADPRDVRKRETSGTALAGVLAAGGARVVPIRVASLRTTEAGSVEALGTTDELLAGLEHAVDPNRDGNTSDHVPVALIGVSAPYAGFARSPEARAIAAATGLGTLVVAPAGEEGTGAGTIGSPGGAPAALTVGALAAAAARVSVQAGDERVADAAALAGAPPQVRGLRLAVRRGGGVVGRVALLRAGADPGAQAAAAAAAGARAVILADPRNRPLAALPAGRVGVPVVGVTGAGARALLAVAPGSGVRFGATHYGAAGPAPAGATGGAGATGAVAGGPLRPAPASATGPTVAGLPKPDVAAPGGGVTIVPGGAAAATGGTAIAAARVAAIAAQLAHARPDLGPHALKAALMASADPAGLPVSRTGAGALLARRAVDVTADPPAVAGTRNLRVRLSAASATAITIAGGAPATLRLRPGRPRTIAVTATTPGAGRLLVRTTTGGGLPTPVPWLIRPATVAPIALGPLATTGGARVDGVRFALGAFHRGDPLGLGTTTQPAEQLVLELIRADGTPVEALTGPGGARELMPGVYAYRLPRSTLAGLAPGRYAFRARAWAPGQTKPTVARSAAFRR